MPQDGGMGPRIPTGLRDNYEMSLLAYVEDNRGNGGVEGDNLATSATAKASEKNIRLLHPLQFSLPNLQARCLETSSGPSWPELN